jgi:hypothetical protein
MFFNVFSHKAHARNNNLQELLGKILSKGREIRETCCIRCRKTLAPVGRNQFIVEFRAELKPEIFALGELLKDVTEIWQFLFSIAVC